MKWRWNLSIDGTEQSTLNQALNGGVCGQTPISMPAKGGTPTAPMAGGFTTAGAIGAKYAADSAVLGAPTSNGVTGRDGGLYQLFERGTIAWTAATGANAVVNGINTVWTGIDTG